LNPWPKLFQNLRATRETDLAEKHPMHVVCAWTGNSQTVAAKHYLQVTDKHYDSAAHNPAQQAHAEGGNTSQVDSPTQNKTPVLQSYLAVDSLPDSELICMDSGEVRKLITPPGNHNWYDTQLLIRGPLFVSHLFTTQLTWAHSSVF
jgi:hypothetical protein